MNFYHSLVLVGSGTASFGTGLLVCYHTQKYILTVSHVIREIEKSHDPPWALIEMLQTLTPPQPYKRIEILDIHNANNGSDLSISKIGPVSGVEFINIDTVPVIKPGGEVKVFGFPIGYMKATLSLNRMDPLFPLQLTGCITETNVPELTLLNQVSKESFMVYGTSIAVMNEKIMFSGLSGAIVTTPDHIPIGMVTGEGKNNVLILSSITKIFELLKKTVA